MNIKLVGLLPLFALSIVQAHHINLEMLEQNERPTMVSDNTMETGHEEIDPCREQHKAAPCEKK